MRYSISRQINCGKLEMNAQCIRKDSVVSFTHTWTLSQEWAVHFTYPVLFCYSWEQICVHHLPFQTLLQYATPTPGSNTPLDRMYSAFTKFGLNFILIASVTSTHTWLYIRERPDIKPKACAEVIFFTRVNTSLARTSIQRNEKSTFR